MVYFYLANQKAIHGFLISIYGSESGFRSRGNHPWFPLYRTQKGSLLTKALFNLLFVCGIKTVEVVESRKKITPAYREPATSLTGGRDFLFFAGYLKREIAGLGLSCAKAAIAGLGCAGRR